MKNEQSHGKKKQTNMILRILLNYNVHIYIYIDTKGYHTFGEGPSKTSVVFFFFSFFYFILFFWSTIEMDLSTLCFYFCFMFFSVGSVRPSWLKSQSDKHFNKIASKT
ncbi:hypothetical protein HMI56_001981 [Coelomomyces lativittatus]|nr:hypothetical protein HMI56_001981 [Coelomomyces lativittatus]